MSCECCVREPRQCQSVHHSHCYGNPHYSDVCIHAPSSNFEGEPFAPTLSLGNRILWLTEYNAASGIVRWIGRIPSISTEWTAGIEFDNVLPGGGNGDFQGRSFFNSRPGHSLFLPVNDLLKVDNPSNSSERTSFFGRLQDSCSNFAHRKRRDSTFGHFKQENCSNCSRYEFVCNGHHNAHGPVYDRISSRRSLHYDEHPYEMYNASHNSVPSSSNHVPNTLQNYQPQKTNSVICTVGDCKNLPSLTIEDRNIHRRFSENAVSDINIERKDSVFHPRNSLRLINGFKEWVSCLVLGTNRKKPKNKLVYHDRKSVTSVYFSRSARGSQSLTGERLSSFAEYASINVTRPPKQHTKVSTLENGNPKYQRSRKKRPAPLPPIPDKNFVSDKNAYIPASNTSVKYETVIDNRNKIVAKTTRTTSFTSHTKPIKRRHKKRRAPLPPPDHVTPTHSEYSSTTKSEKLRNSVVCSDDDMEERISMRRIKKHKFKKPISKDSNKVSNSNNISHIGCKASHRQMNGNSSSVVHKFTESESDNSIEVTSSSVSFSGEDSENEKYGLVKYNIAHERNSSEKDPKIQTNSNYIQYADEEGDVCLKISIQKTETNVFTVEEVSSPHTIHYTIDEDSSSSELSDEGETTPTNKSITFQESKQNSTDSSSFSTEEAADKSKTIFEELQIKPPIKGSVRDFVQAFNMLANKSNADGSKFIPSQNSNSKEISNSLSNTKASQSVPTKWEYQNSNKIPNVVFSSNQFLLPIAEESLNETSEHDGNASFDESNVTSSKLKNKKSKAECLHERTKSMEVKKGDKKCSHCSEKHISPNTANENGSLKKKYLNNHGKDVKSGKDQIHGPSAKDQNKKRYSSQASIAALSSLLKNKGLLEADEGVTNESATSFSKRSYKSDQPIMVGLYIEDKSSHRGPVPLLVTPSMSLKKLKKQVESEYKFPRHQQCWILGESFAVQDDASLASYGVTEPGCPILLYVMTNETKSQSLPNKKLPHMRSQQDHDSSDSSENENSNSLQHHRKKSHRKQKISSLKEYAEKEKNTSLPSSSEVKYSSNKSSLKESSPKVNKRSLNKKKTKIDYHKAWEADFEKKKDYRSLVALDDVDLVCNVEDFECPICFLEVPSGEGAILQDCLHSFCKECLAGAVQYSETAMIKCPFRNDEYSCESHLQEREIKCLVTPDVYDRHLQRSMALAESQALDSFHCKTPDCPGWCLFEDNVNTFLCPVCKKTNCLTCAAIHEGRNCKQYQDYVAFSCDTNEEAKKTKEYLENMVKNGEAMECPQCLVILMKKWGCDWLKCSMCHTEVCWVTKGPRWGPGGKGDTSGGCKCMVNGVRCHPKCSYCH